MSKGIVYYGVPARDGAEPFVRFAEVDGDAIHSRQDLPIRLDLARHALAFEWGIEKIGATEKKVFPRGAAQLALALCVHALADDKRGQKLHQRFKVHAMERWEAGKPWAITADEIAAACDKIEEEEIPAADIAKVNRETVVAESDRGGGLDPGRGGITWTTDENGNLLPGRQRHGFDD